MYSLMRQALARMSEAVHHYEGHVATFTGDGLMALFGAPIAHEDSARRAVAAALRMQAALEEYGGGIERRHGVGCRFRVGLNTGPVVVGTVADDLRMDFTAIGDTVNLAARMEQAAGPGSVLISEPTHRAVEHPLVERHAAAARRRVVSIVPRDDRHESRRIGDRAGQRSEMVERPRQRHRAGAAHATVRGLEAHDAAARRGQPDGAAGVAAQRTEREPRGHGGRRAAAGAAGAVAGLPRILDVAVMGVVPERAHRQLGHVQLAERHRAGLAQARDRRALDRRRKVLARHGAARGRKARHVAEILVGEGHAVERAA